MQKPAEIKVSLKSFQIGIHRRGYMGRIVANQDIKRLHEICSLILTNIYTFENAMQ